MDKNKFKLKAWKVPKLTKQVKYPDRDPSLKEDWRGKVREDYIDTGEVKTIEILNDVNDTSEDDSDEDDVDGLSYSEAALEYAMERSLSIWKSHEGPDEREVHHREQTTRGLIPKFPSKYQPQETETIVELSKTIYTEIFEDADDLSENESNMRSLAQLEDHTDTKNASINDLSNGALLEGPQQDGPQSRSLSDGPLPSALDTVEDWDKEIEDSLAYNLVLETFKQRSYNKVNFQNQLQNLLYSYPPASQAFTKTANYESAVYSFPAPHLCSDQVSCSLDAGQFDDADEEVLAKL